jgi:hypothetical protein
MTHPENRDRRNALRRALKGAEAARAEHRAKYPHDGMGDRDHGKHIGMLANELRGLGGSLTDLDRTEEWQRQWQRK